MRWFDGHVDSLLTRFSQGTLSPRQATRLLRHARACARCGARYERLAGAWRMLERDTLGTPSRTEEAVLADAGLAAALAAAAPEARPGRWRSLAGAGLAALCLAALVLVRPGGEDGWQARGVGRASGATLRVFCAVRGQPLRELKEARGCPPGASLAFAAGARAPLSHVALEVRAQGLVTTEGPFALTGRPGAEQPLEVTVSLAARPGPAEVTAAFAPSAPEALEALRREAHPGAVVLRQPLQVQEAP